MQHQAENAKRVYIFVHIPKTAGSTLRPIIIRGQFDAKAVYQQALRQPWVRKLSAQKLRLSS